MPYEYDYPRPALTVDCAVFAPNGPELEDSDGLDILLIRRDAPPFEGQWATPGGFIDIDEPIEDAAHRELREETGLEDVSLEEFGVFGTPGRDPRGRIVAVAHWALIDRSDATLEAATDAREAEWCAMEALPELAFDHDELVADARQSLRRRAGEAPIGWEWLEPFALEKWCRLHELALGEEVDAETFEAIVTDEGLVERVDETGESGRPLYRCDRERCRTRLETPRSWLDEALS
jgi:8-oxo-dGTP diphosphatase